jgi:hypothetical protein
VAIASNVISFMKSSIARISLVISAILFFIGLNILCTCPGVFALASVFAGAAAWFWAGRMRKWSSIWLVACLIATAVGVIELIWEHRRHQKFIERERINTTNATERTNTVPNDTINSWAAVVAKQDASLKVLSLAELSNFYIGVFQSTNSVIFLGCSVKHKMTNEVGESFDFFLQAIS